jgi:Ctr copper transporter family
VSHATLDTQYKFVGAMISTVALAVAVEGIAKLRHVVAVRAAAAAAKAQHRQRQPLSQQRRPSGSSASSSRNVSSYWWHSRHHRRVALRYTIPLLHGLQAFSGYILMLVTMTYSIELLLCVVLGLTLGYYLFFVRSIVIVATATPDTSLAREETVHLLQHVATNPCCDFLQDASNEPLSSLADRCRDDDDETTGNGGAALENSARLPVSTLTSRA